MIFRSENAMDYLWLTAGQKSMLRCTKKTQNRFTRYEICTVNMVWQILTFLLEVRWDHFNIVFHILDDNTYHFIITDINATIFFWLRYAWNQNRTRRIIYIHCQRTVWNSSWFGQVLVWKHGKPVRYLSFLCLLQFI